MDTGLRRDLPIHGPSPVCRPHRRGYFVSHVNLMVYSRVSAFDKLYCIRKYKYEFFFACYAGMSRKTERTSVLLVNGSSTSMSSYIPVKNFGKMLGYLFFLVASSQQRSYLSSHYGVCPSVRLVGCVWTLTKNPFFKISSHFKNSKVKMCFMLL